MGRARLQVSVVVSLSLHAAFGWWIWFRQAPALAPAAPPASLEAALVWTDVSAPTDVSVTPEISPPAAAGLLPSALPRVPPKRKPSRKKPPAQAEALEASQSSEPQEPASPGSEGAELAQEAMQSMMMGRGREGKASLDACLQAYPKNASCHLLFGVVLEHEGDHQGASAEFNLFLSHAPAGQPVRSTKRHFWLIEILKAHDLTIEEGREVMLWAATRTDAGWK